MKTVLTPAECELKKARQRAYSKKWRDANPEKTRASRQQWRKSSPEKMRAQRKAYRDKHKAELAASKAIYYQNNREYRLAWYHQYYLNNREKVNSRNKTCRLRDRSVNQIRHSPDDVMRIVARAVSDRLPRHTRDDVISSVLLDVLEGKLLLEHVEKRVQEYVRAENRMFDTIGTVSLDSALPGTDLRRIDTITADDLPWARA